jgi:hypothetical protein
MRPVHLVFPADSPSGMRFFGHTSPRRWPASVALFIAAALLTTLVWAALELQREAHAASIETLALHMRVAPHSPASAAKPALTVQQAQDWNLITRQLNIPWATLLDALEASMPEDVAVVAVEPDPARASVRLQVEAKALDILLAYAQSLKAAGPFEEALLFKHETNDQDATRPVRLTIEARLRPGLDAPVRPKPTQ